MSDAAAYAEAAKVVFAEETPATTLAALGPKLLAEFATAESDRRATEERWIKDLRQYKGQYDPEVLAAIGPVRSKAFVRKTRVKVKTVDSRVEDLLFPAGSEKNWEVASTPIPSVSKETRKKVIDGLKQMLAKQMQQMQMQQAAMAQQAQAAGQPMPPMPPMQPPMVTKEMVDEALLAMCKESAKAMAKVIDDQLTEVSYKRICKLAIHSAHLYGTGIIKGPLIERRIRSTFAHENGKWVEKSEVYVVPFVDYVPIWRFYPDMTVDTLDKCRFVYERHLMTHADMAELSSRKSFDKTKIIEHLKANPAGHMNTRLIDNELKIVGDRSATQGSLDGKYEVLERWGYLTGQELMDAGVKVPEDRLHESFFSNVWVLTNGQVIKAVLQPINGVTWPYHIYYFDKDETSIFGDGLASVMRDDQTMLNAATRLMLDNGALSSGPMFEVNTQLLSNYDSATEMGPWKVHLRNNQLPGTKAIHSIDIPSNLGNLSGLADRFDNNLDEVSAIPRYMTGENVSGGAGATKGGLSMLMGAANIMIKDLISSWDEGVTRPFISSLYRWNMQFNKNNDIKGDFDVKARGTASLVAREVRAQQLDNFAAMTANPMDAPFIKRDSLLRQRAEANELTDVVKTEDEVKAEQDNEQMQAQAKLAQDQQTLIIDEMTGKVKLLLANAAKAMAEVDLIKAKATSTKAETVYSALQAGGVAAQNPHIAPAADEILRSSGWQDATPDPSIAGLITMQGDQAPEGALSGGVLPEQSANPVNDLNQPDSTPPDLQPQTGHVGQQAGIETAAI